MNIKRKLFSAILLSSLLLPGCDKKPENGSNRLDAFRLSQVRLHEGPFLRAQQTSKEYILALDMDRLLAPFLKDAGIKPIKENYGNWESTGLDGHIGGHYLSSISLMYAATGDKALYERLEYMLMWLDRCQKKNGNGYVGGIPGGQQIWEEIAEGNIRAQPFSLNESWVPLYNIHKLFSGLFDAYTHANSAKALEILTALSEWMFETCNGLRDEQIQDMLQSEHGGLNEVFTDLYLLKGDKKYLELAKRFSHSAVLDPLKQHKNELTGMHANTQIPKVIGFKKYADATQNEIWDSASDYFWNLVVNNWTVSIGGNSVGEHFHPQDDFSSMVESEQGPETCNTYNMLKLTKLLFLSDPQEKYMDYYERAMYNHILSSQHPEKGGYVYMTPMRPQHYRVYSQAQESFWCCVGSGLENHAKYGELIYAHKDENLYVNMFIPSTLSWEEKGMELTQQTDFPYSNRSQLILKLNSSMRMDIKVRCPQWTEKSDLQIVINGKVQDIKVLPSGYVKLSQRWKNNDTITIDFSTKTRAEYLPDQSNWVSFVHGPIVLAAVVDSAHLDGLWADGGRMGHVASGKKYPIESCPTLELKDQETAESLIEPLKDSPLTFTLNRLKNKEDKALLLRPFFSIHEARYIVYWPVEQ
jgi:uncharacterized protein